VRGRQIVGATECRGLLALEGAWHVKVGVGNFFLESGRGKLFLGHSIGIDDTNTFKWAWQTFFGSMIGIEENNTFKLKICGR